MRFAIFAAVWFVSTAFGAIDPHAIAWQPHVGKNIPIDGEWIDETGRIVRLNDYFADKPTIAALGYFHCTGLCPLTFNGIAEAVRDAKLSEKDFEFIAFSIDETDTVNDAREAKRRAGFGSSNAHFLIGRNNAAKQVARSVGFNYVRDPESSQFAHAAGVVVLTPTGTISSYLFGIRFSPEKLRAALADAKRNNQAVTTSPLLLLCYHFDPRTGKYTFAVMRVAQFIGIATAATLLLLWWRQRA